MLDDEQFAAIAARLQWQLRVEAHANDALPIIPREDGAIGSVWIEFHALKAQQHGRSVASCLEAIHDLLRLGESMATDTRAFWMRILTSQMMVAGCLTPAVLQRLELQIGDQPIQLLIDGSGIELTAENVLEPLRGFMQRQRQPETQRTVIGLRLAKATLSAVDIDALHAILPTSEGATTLERLDVCDYAPTPSTLHALARLLDQHPVQELRLVRAPGRGSFEECAAGLQAVLHSVFSSTVTSMPVRLSLAYNLLNSRLIDAIATQVEKGTRRLAALDITETIPTQDAVSREKIWSAMARLMLTTHRDTEHPCEIDLSGNLLTMQDVARFKRACTDLVTARLCHIQRALADGIDVSCRLIAGIGAIPPGDLGTDPNAVFPVTAVNLGLGRVCIDASPGVPMWVDARSIKSIHSERAECVLSARFNSIVFGAPYGYPSIDHFGLLLATVGTCVRRLSLRWAHDALFALLQLPRLCPRLTHLELDGCRVRNALWLGSIARSCFTTLVSINMAGNMLGVEAVEQLVALHREVPGLALRHLSLKRNDLGAAGLRAVNMLLQLSTTLEVVELDGAIKNDLDGAYAMERAQLTAGHDGRVISAVPLPLASQLAFLHAVGAVTSGSKELDEPLLSLILAFAAQGVARSIIWW